MHTIRLLLRPALGGAVFFSSAALLALLPSCSGVTISDAGCLGGRALCGDTCVDLAADPANCGACGAACPAGERCEAGACTPTCRDGLADCAGGCVDLQSDPLHCGGCDVACDDGEACSAGACGCEAGLSLCSGACVDLQSDPENCGGCRVACAAGAACRAGACLCATGAFEDLGSTVPQTAAGTNVGGPSDYALSCVAPGSPEKVYLFTAPADGAYAFDTFGTGFDTALGLLGAGSCLEIACNDDSGGAQSRLTAELAAGDSVLVVVSGFSGATGPIALHITQPTAPTCPTGALAATVPQTVTGDTSLLGDATAPSCGASHSADASYTFTAPSDGHYVFDTVGSAFNTILEVRDASCAGAALACNDDALGQQSRVELDLAAGQTVVAVVDGYGTQSGAFTLNVSEYVAPPCTPAPLGGALPLTATGSTSGLPDLRTPSCASGGGPDAPYLFTAPSAGTYVFDTFGSAYDTVLHLVDGACSGPPLGCNDDAAGGLQSQLTATLAAGQSVVIFVDGYGSAAGNYALHVSSGSGLCPAADLGATAPQSVAGSTVGRTNVANPSCAPGASGDATYRFTAPSTGTFVFDTAGSTFDTALHVHAGDCSGAELACNNDALGTASQASVSLTAGQSVVVFVDGVNGAAGNYALSVRQAASAPGTCAAPIALSGALPQTVTGSTAGQPDSATPTCATSSAPDTVFQFVAPATATYVIDTVGSTFDTILHVHDASCSGALLGCNDDAVGTASQVTVPLVAGQVVDIVVDGYSTSAGAFTLHIQ